MLPAPARVEIPLFPGGKRLAFTTSWDDGVVEDRRVVAAFNEWGIKGTFNLNSGTLGRTGKPTPAESGARLDASEVASLFAGHEVAIHSVTHPSLHLLDRGQIAQEVQGDRVALEDLVGYPVRGMAYPNGAYDDRVIEVLRGLGIAYCRTTENLDHCFPPANPLTWGATMHMFGKVARGDRWLDLPARFDELYDRRWYSGVFFVWGHTYEFQTSNDWPALERLFKPVSGRPEAWYCTNIELFDYEEARRRLVIAGNRRTAYNPSALAVTLRIGTKLVDVPPGKTIELTP